MTPAQFLATRQPVWNRLDDLLTRIGKRGTAGLTEAELHELVNLYPSVAVDVGRARMYKLDDATQQRINKLAIAAHGYIYRRPAHRPLPAIWRFFRLEYPRLFRRMGGYVLLSTVLFMVFASGAYISTRLRPSTAYVFVPGPIDLPDGQPGLSAEDMSERFREIPNPPLAAGVMANNISVAFKAFAFGITAGVGTCYVLLMNGMILGGFIGHFANHNLQYALWSFIAPHGVLEIFAILVSGAAGFRLGFSLALPGKVTRKASLRAGARDAVLLVLGTIPMFLVAGFIEGFITPSYVEGWLKITLGLLVWALAMAWLLLVGRGAPALARS